MGEFFLATGFDYALKTSSASGIAICAALLILSSFSWAVMITKLIVLRRIRRHNARFLQTYRATEHPLDSYESGENHPHSPAFQLYTSACDELGYQLFGSVEEGRARRLSMVGPIHSAQMEAIKSAMERAVGESVLRLEDKTTILATAVSGAPFLGLLGTVWGVMDTFSSIATASGSASLKDMAPGVSAALLTTVIGLLVAIPAMFGYNFIVQSIKSMIISLENFASELQADLQKFFVRFEVPAPPREPAYGPPRRGGYPPRSARQQDWDPEDDPQDRLL